MPSGPPKLLEDLAKVLIPPVRREEVLGDLYERYKSPQQYLGDLLSTLPPVILSRIMRTTPIQLLLMDSVLVYSSYLAAAYLARMRVFDVGGLVELAIPSGLTLLVLLISSAFPAPLKRSASDWIRSLITTLAVIGLCAAAGLLTEANFYGFVLSSMLVSTAKLMFEPDTRQPQGAGGSALLAGRESRPLSRTVRVRMALLLMVVACLVWWEVLSRRGVNP